MKGRRDNSVGGPKVAARQRIAAALPASAWVLEVFAGKRGLLYERCWERFHGAAMDVDAGAAERAALARPRWAVYRAEAERALRAGFMRHQPFDVLDIDAWGAPWKFLQAWCESERARAAETHVILTDGYMSRVSVGNPDRALWPELDGKRERFAGAGNAAYLARVDERVAAWVALFGGSAGPRTTKPPGGHGQALHYFVIRSLAPAAPESGAAPAATS